MGVHVFGMIGDAPVMEVEIRSQAGARAKILTYGAVVRDLVIPTSSGEQRVVLGLNSIEDYIDHSPSFGAVPGRFANRIANGMFTLDGTRYQLDRKPGEKHTLHGGPKGFGKKIWKLRSSEPHAAYLELVSPDGDSGFPGILTATCVYRFLEPATLRVELRRHRQGDDRQPDPALLFQPGWLARYSRPRGAARLRLLHAGRFRADTDW